MSPKSALPYPKQIIRMPIEKQASCPLLCSTYLLEPPFCL